MKTPCSNIIVDVTQVDIDRGTPGSGERCPIALALERQNICATVSEEDNGMVFGTRGEWCKSWKMSTRAELFTKRFDEDKKVKPSKFKLTNGTQEYYTGEYSTGSGHYYEDEQLSEMYQEEWKK